MSSSGVAAPDTEPRSKRDNRHLKAGYEACNPRYDCPPRPGLDIPHINPFMQPVVPTKGKYGAQSDGLTISPSKKPHVPGRRTERTLPMPPSTNGHSTVPAKHTSKTCTCFHGKNLPTGSASQRSTTSGREAPHRIIDTILKPIPG